MEIAANINSQPKKKKRFDWRRALFIILMMFIPAVHFLFFWVYVNIDTLRLSFQNFDYIKGEYVWYGFNNYKLLLEEFNKTGSVLPVAVKNSFMIFLWNNFIIVPISIIASFVLFKKMPGSNIFKVIFFLPSIISAVVLTLVYQFMFDSTFGIINKLLEIMKLDKIIPWNGWFGDPKTAFKMILIYGLWSGIGYNVVLLSGAMARIPDELFEAGKMDGIGFFGELWHIVVPLIGTNISTLLLMGTQVIFSYFLQPMLLTGGNAANVKTYTIALYIVNNIRNDGNYTMGATVGVICAIVGTPIVVSVRKLLDKTLPAYEY